MIGMKKLLICASRVSHILNFHLPYIEYFKKRGFQVDIAVQGMTEYPLIDNCYDVRFTKNPLSPDNLHTVKLLKKLMSENEYDIVYSNSTLAGASARLAVRNLKKKPYFVHISHGYMFGEKSGLKSKIYLFAERFSRNVTDSLVVMNREDLSLAEKYKLGKEIYHTYGMGLVGENFPEISGEERHEMRKNAGISDNEKMLLCVGEFSERKNQATVIQAFSMLLPKHRNIKLVFAGDGKTLETCRQLVHSLELDTHIRFLGHVDKIAPLYRCSDILVTASKMEGLPFNVMESLYCGVPVVATNIKGHSDLIENGINGFLTDMSAEDICAKLDFILSDENLYYSLRSNTFLDEKYLIENVRPKLLKILDKEYTEEIFIS